MGAASNRHGAATDDEQPKHYDICHYPQGQIRGFPGDLSLKIDIPGDMSPKIIRGGKLEGDSFSGENAGPT
ncbi:hypothetical protein Tco_1096459 [Tanacetum coccineum]